MNKLTKEEWEKLDGKLLHITITDVSRIGEALNIEFYIHEIRTHVEFRTYKED